MNEIDEYRKEIEALEKRLGEIDEERKKLLDKWTETNGKKHELERKIDHIEAENFRKECSEGKHKVVKWKDIPADLRWELDEIEKKISGGCTGDWYDGCRGCEKRCHGRARDEFMKKYGIDKITY